jgi:hypothetical protein
MLAVDGGVVFSFPFEEALGCGLELMKDFKTAVEDFVRLCPGSGLTGTRSIFADVNMCWNRDAMYE